MNKMRNFRENGWCENDPALTLAGNHLAANRILERRVLGHFGKKSVFSGARVGISWPRCVGKCLGWCSVNSFRKTSDYGCDKGYDRQKLNGRHLPPACLVIGKGLEVILRQLPGTGPLFPTITKMDDRSRSCFMWKLCGRLGIQGVSLHSYLYSWAERAKVAGIPQRWAQAALGHNSKAVHEAYARNAQVVCPAIDEFFGSKV